MDLDKQYNNPRLENRRKETLARIKADAALRRSKCRTPDARAQIVAAFDERRELGPVGRLVNPQLGSRKRPLARRALDAMRRVLLAADERSSLLGDGSATAYVPALVRLGTCHARWVRPPEDWRPHAYNVRRQFASLARHLLAAYDVPMLFDAAWHDATAVGDAHRRWWVLIGQGGNLRNATGLPVPLTKLMAHHALNAPDACSIEEAIRWGQARGLGVGERVARAVVGSRLSTFRGPAQEPFWLEVLMFLGRHPMIDPDQVGPIVDYLHAQKFEPGGVVNVNGTFVRLDGPPQPGLSMRGRTPDVLVQQVEAWHRRLARTRDVRAIAWQPSGVAGFDRIEGEPGNQRRVRVVELCDSGELRAEGAAMHHCVATYAGSCAAGRAAIFSLRVDDGRCEERRCTVEVDVRTRRVVQARGRWNAAAAPLDVRMLQAWATTARLTFGAHALTRAR